MTIARQLAKLTAGIQYDVLPKEIITIAKQRILDNIGNAVAGRKYWEMAGDYLRACKSMGTGMASIVGDADTFGTAVAAMINTNFSVANELDDGHKNAGVHAGAISVWTALVVGNDLGSLPKEIIEAVVLGFDVAYRLTTSFNPPLLKGGFHGTSICGSFAAMAVCGKLMRLNEEQLCNGFGLAGLFTSGTLEAVNSAPGIKCVMQARAAFNGIQAAIFAKNNIDGPESIFEGPDGLIRTLTGGFDYENFSRDIGSTYLIKDTYTKLYPMVRHAQPAIEALLQIPERKDLTPADIKAIEVDSYQVVEKYAGKIASPQSATEAQFSLAYCMAVAFCCGEVGIRHMYDPFLHGADIREVASKVTLRVDPNIEALYPKKRGAVVRVLLNDGRTLENECFVLKGSPDKPVSWDDLYEKFSACTSGIKTEAQQTQIKNMVTNLEQASIPELLECLR